MPKVVMLRKDKALVHEGRYYYIIPKHGRSRRYKGLVRATRQMMKGR